MGVDCTSLKHSCFRIIHQQQFTNASSFTLTRHCCSRGDCKSIKDSIE